MAVCCALGIQVRTAWRLGLKSIMSLMAGGKAKHHFHTTMPIEINVTKKSCHARQVSLESACSLCGRQIGLDSAKNMQDILPYCVGTLRAIHSTRGCRAEQRSHEAMHGLIATAQSCHVW